VLATLNAFGLCLLRRAVSRRFGRSTSFLFVFLTCSQFHVPFWMGRTLPNVFAFLPSNVPLISHARKKQFLIVRACNTHSKYINIPHTRPSSERSPAVKRESTYSNRLTNVYSGSVASGGTPFSRTSCTPVSRSGLYLLCQRNKGRLHIGSSLARF
jgi:hypothetical protein